MSLNQKRPAKTLTQKKIDQLISEMFKRLANGVQIPIFDLGKISKAAESVLSTGGEITQAEVVMKEAIELYRVKS